MNNPKILVVEDDASVRNLITTTLKSNDYRYITAPNGASAILLASSQQPDIVLLDLGLPDLDGVEIIRRIRSWSDMPSSSSVPEARTPIRYRPWMPVPTIT